MSVTLSTKMPPTGRDFEVYSAVRVQERTTREVAAEFKISQTRVCQIVERVALFMLEAVPEATEQNHAKRVQLAEQVAAMRVQHLYGTAVRDYEASKGKPVIREINAEGKPKKTITTTKVDVGDVKLLDRAVIHEVVVIDGADFGVKIREAGADVRRQLLGGRAAAMLGGNLERTRRILVKTYGVVGDREIEQGLGVVRIELERALKVGDSRLEIGLEVRNDAEAVVDIGVVLEDVEGGEEGPLRLVVAAVRHQASRQEILVASARAFVLLPFLARFHRRPPLQLRF